MNKDELSLILDKHAKYLHGDDGERANLRDADLSRADLRGADLRGANLRDADLRDADLRGAELRGANLIGASLSGAKLPAFQIPQEGSLIVWKTCGGTLVRLRIPPGAQRTASLVGRKCRAEYAEVLSIVGADVACSSHDKSVVYRPGETVHPDSYDDDPRVECTHGIHFFMTREEAEEY